jgi:succinate dehydrogenase / fumarate reductase cytochrome b subunit
MKILPQAFVIRRLHSVTGIVPLGAFLFEHFFTNSFSHHGALAYNEKVEFLRTLPYVAFLEWGFIFIPFLFHAILGVYIMWTGSVNMSSYGFTRNWLYFFQRVSSFFVLLFVVQHVLQTRFGMFRGPLAETGGLEDFYDLMSRIFNDPLMVTVYVIGILSTCFHFANGLSTFCMTWGLTISRQSQRLVGYACLAIGVTLAAMALWSMVGFRGEGQLADLERAATEHVSLNGSR